MSEPLLGFIGGSGLYEIESLADRREIEVSTPFGYPSDAIVQGSLDGVEVAFLPRHGRGHRIAPTEIPARANIYALKSLGVQMVVSVSAVGSLKEEIRPLDLVIPDQLIDRTRLRQSTFFGQGLVAHVGFADPFCPVLREVALKAVPEELNAHDGGTYVVMEGPQFSTRAESALYRSWGASVIGMTALAGGEAGARGGDVLPDAGVRDGLRRVARERGRGVGGVGRSEPDEATSSRREA